MRHAYHTYPWSHLGLQIQVFHRLNPSCLWTGDLMRSLLVCMLHSKTHAPFPGVPPDLTKWFQGSCTEAPQTQKTTNQMSTLHSSALLCSPPKVSCKLKQSVTPHNTCVGGSMLCFHKETATCPACPCSGSMDLPSCPPLSYIFLTLLLLTSVWAHSCPIFKADGDAGAPA